MNRLREKLEAGKFVITCEVTPPKGGDMTELREKVGLLGPLVDGLNVTDNNRAVLRMCSLACCAEILRQGYTPVMQVACRDRNRLGIQADILGASGIGIRNILCLTGDPVKIGDDPEAKLVGELNSQKLLQVVRFLNEGRDAAGNPLTHPTQIYPGAASSPTLAAPEKIGRKILEKIEAGAKFFQTQAVYDIAAFERYMKWHRKECGDTKVIAGIFVLRGPKHATFVQKMVPGLQIPDSIVEQLSKVEDTHQAGIELAAKQAKELRNVCDGVHIMAVKQEEKIPTIIEMASL